MRKWEADFTNDPFDDYNPIIEILCDDVDVAVVKNGDNGLEIKFYPIEKELVVPLNWLDGLLKESKKRFDNDQWECNTITNKAKE